MKLTDSQRWALACAAELARRYGLDEDDLWTPPPLVTDPRASETLLALTGVVDREALHRQLARYEAEGSERVTVDLAAWDSARLVLSAVLGLRAGVLSRREALAVLLRAARLAQGAYRSWAEYARGYVAGRWHWMGYWDDDPSELDAEHQALLADERAAWRTLPWDLPFDEDEDEADDADAVDEVDAIECADCGGVVPVREVSADGRCPACGGRTTLDDAWSTTAGIEIEELDAGDADDPDDLGDADPDAPDDEDAAVWLVLAEDRGRGRVTPRARSSRPARPRRGRGSVHRARR